MEVLSTLENTKYQNTNMKKNTLLLVILINGIFSIHITGQENGDVEPPELYLQELKQEGYWQQSYLDEKGRILIGIIRYSQDDEKPADSENSCIKIIIHYQYDLNGNVSEWYEYYGDGRLKQKVIVNYDDKGQFLYGDVYMHSRNTGKFKKFGKMLTKPEYFMYGDKEKNVPVSK